MDDKDRWAALAVPGRVFPCRVTPRARRTAIERTREGFRITVTAPPEDGRANAAVAEVLARALGVAPSRLTLVRGASARDKLFRLD